MAAATVAGSAIRKALAEFMGGWCVLSEATGTGAASYIEDTERFKGTNLPSTMFDNCVVRVTSGTRQGNVVNVDYLDPITGFLYVTPDLSGALSAGDDYEIWQRGIDPDIVDRLRDDCLERFCSQWRVVAFSVVTDGDLQSSGVASWTVAAGASRSKVYSAFPDAHARRRLNVVHTTAATDYVSSDSVYVNPGERFFLEVNVAAYVTSTNAAATGSIIVRDITNGANIILGGKKTTHIGRGQGHINLLWTVPAGCYEIQLRLTSDTAASTTSWGPFFCHKRSKTRQSLPDRITTRKRVGRFFDLTTVNAAQSEQSDNFYKYVTRLAERIQIGSQVEVNFDVSTGENAIAFYERGFFERLSATYFTDAARVVGDDAATDCPKEYIVAALAERIAKHYMDIYGAEWQDDWVRASTELAYWEGEFGPEPQIVEENETPVGVPQLWV